MRLIKPAARAAATAAVVAAAVLLAAGCAGTGPTPPTPMPTLSLNPAADYGAAFDGSIDEVIGADGTAAAGFADADYVQLRRRDDIPPIYAPQFVAAADADLADDALIIGLAVNGAARAYPLGILYRRELVNDVVGGVPVLVSWCPRCYTALAHDRRFDRRTRHNDGAPVSASAAVSAATAVFGNQGALYLGAMTWYDHDTGSVWSQPLGAAIAGPLAGAALRLLPAQLAEWGRWRAAYPDTLLLTPADDGAAAQPYRGRRLGDGQVVGVVIGGVARAWPYQLVVERGPVAGMVGDTPVVVWRDGATGAVRAAAGGSDGGDGVADGAELPVIIADGTAWRRFYPDGAVADDAPRFRLAPE